ncbi:MAG TPA: histidine kinase [Puia sp.]|nr:histidine kinase [Puia sp.]
MGKRLFLLLGSFIAFYYLIRVGYDMPNLVHGNPLFIWWPGGIRGWGARILDIAFYFLFTLIPYLSLLRWYPVRKAGVGMLVILVSLPALFLLRYWITIEWVGRGGRLKTYFENTIFYVLIFSVYGAVFYFIRYSRYKELQQKDLEIQNRQSELSFLRSQINPHFLFNNLNNIYSLVYQGSEQALTAIAGLSELLRYMLYDTMEKVPLQKELDYIRKYIELQKLRFDHPIKVAIQVEHRDMREAAAEVEDALIPPLLLIPFVENAFKHGDFSGTEQGLTITVFRDVQKIVFHCRNRKAAAGKQQRDAGGGIGLENVRRRLLLLYPGRHSLRIEEDTFQYTVDLELVHEGGRLNFVET